MYSKKCGCGNLYIATGPAAKYCSSCKVIADEITKTKNRDRATKRRREEGRRVGAGQLPGKLHVNYKHGYYVAQTQSRLYRKRIRWCERCGVDTRVLDRWHWVMHHKDHNHFNHEEDNLELLCKRCHAIEHDVQDNITKVQRLSRKGVGLSSSKRMASQEDDDIV